MSDEKRNFAGKVSLVMALTLLGKLLGLVRDRLLAVNFGAGMEASAFLTASRIPRVFFDTLFSSAIVSSFIPVFSERLAAKGKRSAFEFSSGFITAVAIASVLLAALGAALAEPLVRLFADGYDEKTAALCANLTRLMFPTVVFTGVAFCFVGVLQSLDEFNVPAIISAVANLAVIAYYPTLSGRFGIKGLAVAFLLGWFLQAAVQVPALRKKGFFYRPSLDLGSESMRKVFSLMLPSMVSTWVLPVNLTIGSRFGSHLFGGAGVAAIELASNLHLMAAGIFVLSVANVVFPKLSLNAAKNDLEAFESTLRRTVHACMFVVLPMTAGLMLLARPLVGLIYGGGAFGDSSVALTSKALAFMSVGTAGYALQSVLSRACFALGDGKTALASGGVSIAVNLALCALLTGPMDVAGPALATSAASIAGAAVFVLSLRAKGFSFGGRRLFSDLLKMTFSTAAMAAAVYLLLGPAGGALPGLAGKLFSAAAPAAAGLAVYSIVSAALGLAEAKGALSIARGILKGKKA